MRTYAEYLNSLTVKSLNIICKQAGIKGYSKLRKAELIKGITAMVELAEIEAHKESAETPTSHKRIAEVTFFSAPAKAPQSAPKARITTTPKATTNPYASESTDDLSDAYKLMTATLHNARGITHSKIAAKVRMISKVLRERKVNMRALYV